MANLKSTIFKARKKRSLKIGLFVICEDETFGFIYLNKLKPIDPKTKIKHANKETSVISIVKKCIKCINNDNEETIAVKANKFCIFDADNNTQSEINEANKLAIKNGIQLIMNNPCIEYWFLSHFSSSNSYLSVDNTIKKLKKIYKGYDKRSKFPESQKLLSDLIKNTEKACAHNQKKHKNISDYLIKNNNPSSNMHMFIKLFQNP